MYDIKQNKNVYSCCGHLYIMNEKIRNIKCPFCGSKITVKCEVPMVYEVTKK